MSSIQPTLAEAQEDMLTRAKEAFASEDVVLMGVSGEQLDDGSFRWQGTAGLRNSLRPDAPPFAIPTTPSAPPEIQRMLDNLE
jgi:hypothetical protein